MVASAGGSAQPLVSFVVPCYNYARFLPNCLESIFSLDGAFLFEVIAIDDASTDRTQDVLRQFADPRLRVITHETNCGHVETINEGLHATRGTFVARIDPDDRYRPHFLTSTLDVFGLFPEVGMVYGDAAIIDEQGTIAEERSDRVHGGRDFKGNELVRLLAENFICAPTVIARREAWLGAVPVPKGLAFNDWYFTLQMARRYDFYYVNTVLAEYRVHASNHHTAVARDGSEERSIALLLNRIYAETEADPALEMQKRQARRRIYASNYRIQADKYFGFGADADARRCYLAALRMRPQLAFHAGLSRRLLGSMIGHPRYESAKRMLKRVAR